MEFYVSYTMFITKHVFRLWFRVINCALDLEYSSRQFYKKKIIVFSGLALNNSVEATILLSRNHFVTVLFEKDNKNRKICNKMERFNMKTQLSIPISLHFYDFLIVRGAK